MIAEITVMILPAMVFGMSGIVFGLLAYNKCSELEKRIKALEAGRQHELER